MAPGTPRMMVYLHLEMILAALGPQLSVRKEKEDAPIGVGLVAPSLPVMNGPYATPWPRLTGHHVNVVRDNGLFLVLDLNHLASRTTRLRCVAKLSVQHEDDILHDRRGVSLRHPGSRRDDMDMDMDTGMSLPPPSSADRERIPPEERPLLPPQPPPPPIPPRPVQWRCSVDTTSEYHVLPYEYSDDKEVDKDGKSAVFGFGVGRVRGNRAPDHTPCATKVLPDGMPTPPCGAHVRRLGWRIYASIRTGAS